MAKKQIINPYLRFGARAQGPYCNRVGGGIYARGISSQSVYPKLIETFDDLSRITVTGVGATVEVDTNPQNFIDGDASIKVTIGTSNASVDIEPSPIPMSDFQNFVYRLRMPAVTSSPSSSFVVNFGTDPGFAPGTWTGATLVIEEGWEGGNSPSGWNFIKITKDKLTSGTPSILDQDNPIVIIRITAIANRDPFYLDALYQNVNLKGQTQYLFMIDDASDTWFEVNDAVFGTGKSAIDYLEDNGIIGTWYLIGSLVDQPGPNVTTAQMQRLYDAGWDLCPHTITDVTTLTKEQFFAELDAEIAVLSSNGWNRGREHFAFPGGQLTWGTHDQWCREYGLRSARTIQATLINRAGIDFGNLFYLFAKGAAPGVTAQSMTDYVDKAILENDGVPTQQTLKDEIAMTYIHSLDEAETGPQDWAPTKVKAFVDHIVAKRDANELAVTSISRWVPNSKYA